MDNPPTPTVTLTRTIIRFRQGGKVIREVTLDPLTKIELGKILKPNEHAAYLVWLAETQGPEAVAKHLDLPPYLRLVIPTPDPGQTTLWRSMAMSTISTLLDPEYRKSMLIRYLESIKSQVVASAVEKGIPEREAEKAYRALINEVASCKTMEEVKRYEKTDPLDYIARMHRARIALTA